MLVADRCIRMVPVKSSMSQSMALQAIKLVCGSSAGGVVLMHDPCPSPTLDSVAVDGEFEKTPQELEVLEMDPVQRRVHGVVLFRDGTIGKIYDVDEFLKLELLSRQSLGKSAKDPVPSGELRPIYDVGCEHPIGWKDREGGFYDKDGEQIYPGRKE